MYFSFTNALLWARYWAKLFLHIVVNPYHTLVSKCYVFLFFSKRNWELENWADLSKILQLIHGKIRIKTSVYLSEILILPTASLTLKFQSTKIQRLVHSEALFEVRKIQCILCVLFLDHKVLWLFFHNCHAWLFFHRKSHIDQNII